MGKSRRLLGKDDALSTPDLPSAELTKRDSKRPRTEEHSVPVVGVAEAAADVSQQEPIWTALTGNVLQQLLAAAEKRRHEDMAAAEKRSREYMDAAEKRRHEDMAEERKREAKAEERSQDIAAKIEAALVSFARRQPTEPINPPEDAELDECGRYVDLRYRLSHAHDEFGLPFPPDVFTALSEHHHLEKLLKFAAEEPTELTDGVLINRQFLSLFRLQDEQLLTCSLYVRKSYVAYRKLLLKRAQAYQKTGVKLACRLGGNPGIGKSTFLVYYLLELLKEAHRNIGQTEDADHADGGDLADDDNSEKKDASRPLNPIRGDNLAGAESEQEKVLRLKKEALRLKEEALRLKEEALRLKIFLSDGVCYYVYSRRTGWLQVKKEKNWIQMHRDNKKNEDAWLLVDSYDLPATASRKILLVSSPNISNFARFAKTQPTINVLPTLSWDEVKDTFNQLLKAIAKNPMFPEDVRKDASDGRMAMSWEEFTPSEDEQADDTSEIAEFFRAPAGEPFYLDLLRLQKRFDIWGGVLRTVFSLKPLAGLKSLFKAEKAAKLWKQFIRGDFALFETATEENGKVNIPATNVLHGIFEPVHDKHYNARFDQYKYITERGKAALVEWLSSMDSKALMETYIEGSRTSFAGDLFEALCHSFFTCRTNDRSLYLRDYDNSGKNYDGALWLDLPVVSKRILEKLSDAKDPVDKTSKLLYFKPTVDNFKGLDSIFYPGIVLQITIKQNRPSDELRTLRDQLVELLHLWKFPPEGEKYMVAYVVPGTKFKMFRQIGKGVSKVSSKREDRVSIEHEEVDSGVNSEHEEGDLDVAGEQEEGDPDVSIEHAEEHSDGSCHHEEGRIACPECCDQYFDFKVFGMPLPGASRQAESKKFKLNENAGERWTLNLKGKMEKKSCIIPVSIAEPSEPRQ